MLDLEESNWTVDMEIALFHALEKLRPVGIHKHFRMINIQRIFNKRSPCAVSVASLWKKMKSIWNMDALDLIEQEDLHSEEYETPSAISLARWAELKEPRDFCLYPYEDFDHLIRTHDQSSHKIQTKPDTSIHPQPHVKNPPNTPQNLNSKPTTSSPALSLRLKDHIDALSTSQSKPSRSPKTSAPSSSTAANIPSATSAHHKQPSAANPVTPITAAATSAIKSTTRSSLRSKFLSTPSSKVKSTPHTPLTSISSTASHKRQRLKADLHSKSVPTSPLSREKKGALSDDVDGEDPGGDEDNPMADEDYAPVDESNKNEPLSPIVSLSKVNSTTEPRRTRASLGGKYPVRSRSSKRSRK